MSTYRAPGVFVEQGSGFPPSVTEVASAIPAFIGYTAKATEQSDGDLTLIPKEIRSFSDFERFFGGPEAPGIRVAVRVSGAGLPDGVEVEVKAPRPSFLLPPSLRLFFANGGGRCFVVSVGSFTEASERPTIGALHAGLDRIAAEDTPTLLVIPDAVRLSAADYGALARAVLKQCADLGDRFGIFDLHQDEDTALDSQGRLDADSLSRKRELFGAEHLRHGAAYYPRIRSDIPVAVRDDKSNVSVTIDGAAPIPLAALEGHNIELFDLVLRRLGETCIADLPVGAAVAGAYAKVDRERGVWKAPANVPLVHVIEPMVRIDDAYQEHLSVDPVGGKPINAIRSFPGRGTRIWGARTLAGNDNEHRYISVRRFLNTVEESVSKATSAVVFEPNNATTWSRVRTMLEGYLLAKWREGALVGAKPEQAFFVRCGLGVTMTQEDVREGRLIIEILLAVLRPAEFVVLRFLHKLPSA